MKIKSNIKYRASIDITSLLDLLFLLLIFFMVTSSLNIESSILVNLPKSAASGVKNSGSLVVTISESNEIFVNDRKVKGDELAAFLKKYKIDNRPGSVVIRGDKKSNYQTIVEVMDKLNQSGLPKFTLSTVK